MPDPDRPSPPPRADSPPESRPVPARNSWAYPVMWMVIVLMLVFAGLYVFRTTVSLPGKAVDAVGQRLEAIAAAFKHGTVTTSFTEYAATIGGSQDFQFAHLSEKVAITNKDEKTVAWGHVPLPDVIVSAEAPVTFTYYLNLNDHWDFTMRDGTIFVVAPRILYNNPAVDVSHIAYTVQKDSMFRDTGEAMENLRRSITSQCQDKAKENIGKVRETGREQTAIFVRNWLAKSFTDGKDYKVVVRFRDETGTEDGGVKLKTE
jgi:hypothetical protein